ncbi:MAG: phospholipase B family protein, partial [Acidobacteriota bacterium]|nr:phospholipase B family protein [Acidobacteriota bacterium]
MRRSNFLLALLFCGALLAFAASEPQPDARLKNSFRKPDQNGWTFVHLEGSPAEIGFQHGYLLAPEILEGQKVTALELTHDTHKTWEFFRDSARNVLWPHIEPEYREELQGISQGLNAKGIKLDVWDVTALNASLEWSYYVKQFNKRHGVKSPKTVTAPDHCSAFAATGSYTKDGKVIIGHNNWTNYLDGERWTMVFDITPAKGNRFIMDGFPGFIHSGDDFGVNSAGIAITETTITGFSGWDSNGIPEFVRARKAMQYSSSIDDFARIMK